MTPDEIGPWVGLLGVILGGLIAWWTKRTPEKMSPEKAVSAQLDWLTGQMESMRTQMERQEHQIDELSERVDRLDAENRHLVRHAGALAGQVTELGGEPIPPPPAIRPLFD